MLVTLGGGGRQSDTCCYCQCKWQAFWGNVYGFIGIVCVHTAEINVFKFFAVLGFLHFYLGHFTIQGKAIFFNSLSP